MMSDVLTSDLGTAEAFRDLHQWPPTDEGQKADALAGALLLDTLVIFVTGHRPPVLFTEALIHTMDPYALSPRRVEVIGLVPMRADVEPDPDIDDDDLLEDPPLKQRIGPCKRCGRATIPWHCPFQHNEG